jgi:hypothetical protein
VVKEPASLKRLHGTTMGEDLDHIVSTMFLDTIVSFDPIVEFAIPLVALLTWRCGVKNTVGI